MKSEVKLNHIRQNRRNQNGIRRSNGLLRPMPEGPVNPPQGNESPFTPVFDPIYVGPMGGDLGA